MHKGHVWVSAVLAVLVLGVGASRRAWSEEPPQPQGSDSALQQAAYDVIIVPRERPGAPRILTDRGWRSLRSPEARVRGNQRRSFPHQEARAEPWPDHRYGRQPRWSEYSRPQPERRDPYWRDSYRPWPRDAWQQRQPYRQYVRRD